jgi:hypothetical protein
MSKALEAAIREAETAIKRVVLLARDSGELAAAMRAMLKALTVRLPYQEAGDAG